MNDGYRDIISKINIKRRLILVFLLISLQGVSQIDSTDYFSDSIITNKKRLNSYYKLEIGLSTHEYTINYSLSPSARTAQYEVASSFHIGYQFIDDYFNFGVLAKKGFNHYMDQPAGVKQTPALSYPWIMETGGALNLFFFRKRQFFLGPMVNYTFLYDSKHNLVNHLVGLGFIFRKKWFVFRVSFHKYLYSKNNYFVNYTENSLARTIGVIIPIYKIQEIKKKKG